MNETPTIESVVAYKCSSCEHLSEDEPDSPLYECGSCGTTFTRDTSADGGSNRCPDCNKFGAKAANYGCAECNEAEVEETEAYPCPECGELFDEESGAAAHCTESAIIDRKEAEVQTEVDKTGQFYTEEQPAPSFLSWECAVCGTAHGAITSDPNAGVRLYHVGRVWNFNSLWRTECLTHEPLEGPQKVNA